MWNFIKKLNGFREIIWPLLEPLEEKPPIKINEAECKWNENETDMMLEYVEKYRESEEKRRQEVESKSTIFIGTFGVAATVLISLIKDMILNNSGPDNPIKLFLIFVMTLSIIYSCRAIWFAIKALERKSYYTTGFPNFMLTDCVEKKKKLIIMQYNNTKRNQDIINIKVDYMTMAQEYFKRAIIVVALFSAIVLLNYILVNMTMIKSILNIFKSLSINQITLIVLFVSLIILFISVIVLLLRIKKLEKLVIKE